MSPSSITSRAALTSSAGAFSALKIILRAGLVAGVLDAAAGVVAYFIWFGYNPLQVLQFIASGVFGPAAFAGGFPMVLAGLGLHFAIAFVVAAVYFLLYPRLAVLRRYPWAMGLLFGLGVWLVMNLLVLPASHVAPAPFDAGLASVGIGWHMLLVGLPIALITRKYTRRLVLTDNPHLPGCEGYSWLGRGQTRNHLL